MTETVTVARWEEAQAAELRYWQGVTLGEILRICAEKPQFLALLDSPRLSVLFDGKDVLEIGCGPLGLSIASFYENKAAIRRLVKAEPLSRMAVVETAAGDVPWARPFIDWVDALCAEGDYVQRPGEALEFIGAFDTVVTYNVLDHVRDPRSVLRCAANNLRPDGHILVGVDCLSMLGRLKFEGYVRRALKGSILVEAHPHTFLPKTVVRLLEEAGFTDVVCFGIPTLYRRLAGSASRPAFLARKPR